MAAILKFAKSYYIGRGQMLRDNALKFYSDHAYIIPQKPFENRQYMNKNGSSPNCKW